MKMYVIKTVFCSFLFGTINFNLISCGTISSVKEISLLEKYQDTTSFELYEFYIRENEELSIETVRRYVNINDTSFYSSSKIIGNGVYSVSDEYKIFILTYKTRVENKYLIVVYDKFNIQKSYKIFEKNCRACKKVETFNDFEFDEVHKLILITNYLPKFYDKMLLEEDKKIVKKSYWRIDLMGKIVSVDTKK